LRAARIFSIGIFVLFLSFLASSSKAEDGYSFGPKLDEPSETSSEPNATPFHFDQRQWNKMRRTVEDGNKPGEEKAVVQVSSQTAEIPKPPPGQINFELPYESSLSITGRKIIKVDIENKHITKEQANELGVPQDVQTFNMEQELQAKIQGTVARKTTINVNFDDTKENVRDFSVVYKGDPDEVVQEAAFGDIVLSLPATEFVNYQKQLFGIRTALKYKKAGLMVIGSRTKGTTETRRFTGSTERKQKPVNDVDYIRRRYYDLTFSSASAMQAGPLSGKTILPLSDAIPEQVFIEDTTGLLADATDYVVAVPTAPATTTSIRMRRMSRGVDYSIDRLRGIITFTRTIDENVRLAIDFSISDGSRLINQPGVAAGVVGVLIKDKTPEAPEASQEIKRFYNTGDRNIVRDNGLGNFVFQIKDPNKTSVILTTITYPNQIDMNFDTGIFEVKTGLPFPDIYAPNVQTGTPLHAVFILEYQALKRTFFLRANIVLQSETITVDGRKLTRDLDYFIDYDIGNITFFNDDLIRDSSIIEATYEFAPFGGQLGETLVGARGTYDIVTNKKIGAVGFDSWTAGSTVLYNFAARPTAPPDIRSTPASLLVTEGDTKVSGLKFGSLPINSNFTLEAAQSRQNPNLFGRALIDSMEGIRQEDSSSLLKDSWLIARPLFTAGANSIADFQGRDNPASHIQWYEADALTADPNDGNTTQKALNVIYDFNTVPTDGGLHEQAAIVNVISLAGRDFSKKTSLDIELQGTATGTGVEMFVEYGTFNEDSDGDGILDTEDLIPFDGVLNAGEDTGHTFNGPGDDLSLNTSTDNINVRIGARNARMDTEDLTGDRVLNTTDRPATDTPLFEISALHPKTVNGTSFSDVSFTTRTLFSIPLNFDTLSEDEKARLLSVRQVRITIRNTDTTRKTGGILITKLSVSGNTWQPAVITPTGSSSMTVTAINNKDDINYFPLFGNPDFDDLYKGTPPDSKTKEQALALTYYVLPTATATTKNVFGATRDFSKHDLFKFFVSKRNNDVCTAGDCGQLFLQAGSDTEYQQINIDISKIPVRSWMLVTIRQADRNNDGTPDSWESLTPNVTVTQTGNVPSLTSVSQMKIGVFNNTPSSSTISNQIWVNEIFEKEPHERLGNAKRYSFDSAWTGWMDFGGTYRTVDRNFETPTTAVTNQDHTQRSSFINFSRLKFLPMTFKRSEDETKTPAAFRTSNNALVSFLQEGTVRTVTNNSTARLLLPNNLPAIDFSYDNSEQKANLTQRTDTNDTWRVGTSITSKGALDLLPGKFLTFRPIPTSITYSHTQAVKKVRFSGTDTLLEFGVSTAPFSSTNLVQTSREDDVRMSFKPFDSLTFNPSYKLRVDQDQRDFRQQEIDSLNALNGRDNSDLDNKKTPHAIAQTLTAQGSLRILKWLVPQYNYSLSGTETNNTPDLNNTTSYMRKSINRSGSGEVSGTIQLNQVLPRFRPVQSLNFNTSYKLEAGDSYENMDKDFEWRNKLWAGKGLEISTDSTNGLARRTSLTNRKTFRTNSSWLPWSGYRILDERWKPLSTVSLTNNYQTSIEDQETTGTNTHIKTRTFPDLIVSISDIEKFFLVRRFVDKTRLTVKDNETKKEVTNISLGKSDSLGGDGLFTLFKKFDVATSFSLSHSREDNLITQQLTSKSRTRTYSVQTGFPIKTVWRLTPRYEKTQTDAQDSIRITNDLVAETFSLQINGDLDKPLGLRVGRSEYGLTNRFIVSSLLKWDKKRSKVNPSTGQLDIYSGTLSGDYTLSKNFRVAVGGNFAQEIHYEEFKKLNTTTFGINSTLTIQF
jgi:hypothetical protein